MQQGIEQSDYKSIHHIKIQSISSHIPWRQEKSISFCGSMQHTLGAPVMNVSAPEHSSRAKSPAFTPRSLQPGEASPMRENETKKLSVWLRGW